MFYFHYLRLSQGLTQVQLHQLTGINQAHISLMELGRLIPTHHQLDALADAFGVSPRLVMQPVTVTPPTVSEELTEAVR
jgi:transcriptional regulator with XRE-family HTH domain